MKSDVVIIVEDKNDVVFLRDLILINYEYYKQVSENGESEFLLGSASRNILIKDTKEENERFGTGGWNKIKTLIQTNYFEKKLKTNPDVKFLVVFDADEDKNVNIKHKEKLLDEWLKEKDFNIGRFYLPFNNTESHNLEQLLQLSFSKPFEPCWNEFAKCMNRHSADAVEPQSKKGKIIVYKDFYSKLKNAKNEYLSEIWDISFETNSNLQPLKSFLDTYLL